MIIERISVDDGRKSLGDALALDRGDHPAQDARKPASIASCLFQTHTMLEKTKSGKLSEPSLL